VNRFLTIELILLLAGVCISPAFAQETDKPHQPSKGNWLYVGGNGPGNYTKIQDALENASDEDTVFVYNGTYYENLIIDKEILLVGYNKNNTIIDGSTGNESVILLKADNVHIEGFTITNSSPYQRGIFFRPNCTGASIIDNIITHNRGALYVPSSRNTNISRNILIDNYLNPTIEFTNSSDNTIYGNIVIQTSENKTDAISVFSHSNNNTIIGNTVSTSLSGISVGFSSKYNRICENSIKQCRYGVYLSGASSNEVSSNVISDNEQEIFLVWYSGFNTIHANTISKNTIGLLVEITSNSSDNLLYHNNFLNNTNHVFIAPYSTNKWDNGYPSCGNYWDDYVGEDNFSGPYQNLTGRDGVGDTPYDTYGRENKDRYPLMEPYGLTTLSLDFKGGVFKYSGILQNIGNTTAFNVHWDIGIDGGIILIGGHTSGTVPKPLLAGEEAQVSSSLMLGFGKIIITIAVWADNAPYVSKSTPAILLLFFVII